MKVLLLCVLLAFAQSSFATIAKDPEDIPHASTGECKSGLPSDGHFNKCSLDPSTWRVGARSLGVQIAENDVTWTSDFTSLPPFIDSSSTANSCAIRVPGTGVIFQYVNYPLYAHYRLGGCAKVHGNSPCRIEMRNWRNHLLDYLEFSPSANSSCLGTQSCLHWDNATRYTSISIRYQGEVSNTIAVRLVQNILDASFDRTFDVLPGEEFNITVADLLPAAASLPDYLILIDAHNHTDVLPLFGQGAILPGTRFGDDSQYLLSKAWVNEDVICPTSEAADAVQCPCEETDVQQVCLQSSKGFVALPGDEYYIGLVSGDCSCEFDDICLSEVKNQEGYFGVNWILVGENSTSTSV